MSHARPILSLSATEARMVVLRAQGLIADEGSPRTPGEVLRRVGYVQLDTISVLARSHELVAYARVGPTPRHEVEAAYWSRPASAFEYYGHANCILPIESWPYFAFKRRAYSRLTHSDQAAADALAASWSPSDEASLVEVRARLRDGPVTVTELGGGHSGSNGWWNWSAAKRAMELLYARGEAICAERRGWKRVYDLPERVVPAELLAHEPSDAECISQLLGIAARAFGVGTRRDLVEYFSLMRGPRAVRPTKAVIERAIEDLELVPVEVEGWDEVAYACPDALRSPVLGHSRTTLLSPFDSLVWDREIAHRTERLFGFQYALEAYVPSHKRVHGYFVMPVLSEGRLVGRVDPLRKGQTLIVRKASLEHPDYAAAVVAALAEAAAWVGCDAVVCSESVAGPLRQAVSAL